MGGAGGWVRGVLGAQEARARAYARFRGGFRAYLAAEGVGGGARAAAEGAFQAACEEATAAFAAASEQIRGFEAKLKEEGGQEGEVLAGLVRRLQEHEKANLELTVTLQVLRKSHAAGRWTWQSPSASGGGGEAGGGWGVSGGGGGPVDGGGCGPREHAPPEPTEEEYSNAVAEATQALEEHVGAINEALAELRECLEVLEDD